VQLRDDVTHWSKSGVLPSLLVLNLVAGLEWILLGETTTVVLAIFCSFGLGYAAFAALLLKEQREP